jgi:hypothetical protein
MVLSDTEDKEAVPWAQTPSWFERVTGMAGSNNIKGADNVS